MANSKLTITVDAKGTKTFSLMAKNITQNLKRFEKLLKTASKEKKIDGAAVATIEKSLNLNCEVIREILQLSLKVL